MSANAIDYSVFYNILPQPDEKEEPQLKTMTWRGYENLAVYHERLENHSRFKVKFESKSNEGALIYYDEGIQIIMPVVNMDKQIAFKSSKRIQGNEILDSEYAVFVTSIDETGAFPVVYVSNKQEKQLYASAARKVLNTMIEQHDLTMVPAKVVMVNIMKKYILLDICGYGIKGWCAADNWSNSYVNDIVLAEIKTGDVVDVCVIGKPQTTNRIDSGAYKCTRIVKNPYAGLEKRFPKGTILNARLIECYKNKGFCFLKVNGFDRVNILCYFPWLRDKKWKDNFQINELVSGREYRVLVIDVNEKKRRFRGRIVGTVNSQIDEQMLKRAERKSTCTEGCEAIVALEEQKTE